MPDIQPYLQKIVDQISRPEVQAALKGLTRRVQFRFSDTQEDWLLRVTDGREAALTRETLESPDILVATTSQVLADLMDRKINPTAAYMSGQIRIKASMADMLRLQKLM
jgi:putative sterol carrier protein